MADERRSVESRLLRLEDSATRLDTRLALTEQRVEQIRLTMNSRHDAMEEGQSQLIIKMETEKASVQTQLEPLKQLANQANGAFLLVKFLGIAGLIGFFVTLAKVIRGGP